MGYFSNGSEGDAYEAKYCNRCVHSGEDGTGCNVMLAHVLFAYEECNRDSNAKRMLDMLIPRDGAFNGECTMFVPVDRLAKAQGDLFGKAGR